MTLADTFFPRARGDTRPRNSTGRVWCLASSEATVRWLKGLSGGLRQGDSCPHNAHNKDEGRPLLSQGLKPEGRSLSAAPWFAELCDLPAARALLFGPHAGLSLDLSTSPSFGCSSGPGILTTASTLRQEVPHFPPPPPYPAPDLQAGSSRHPLGGWGAAWLQSRVSASGPPLSWL